MKSLLALSIIFSWFLSFFHSKGGLLLRFSLGTAVFTHCALLYSKQPFYLWLNEHIHSAGLAESELFGMRNMMNCHRHAEDSVYSLRILSSLKYELRCPPLSVTSPRITEEHSVISLKYKGNTVIAKHERSTATLNHACSKLRP